MWIALSLVAACGSAASNVILKRAVREGGAIASTVAFRTIAGLLLVALVTASVGWPSPTPAYWRALALVIPPEIGGMLFMSLALRGGELSLVQPILGLLPLFVMAGGALFLRELPSPSAAAGVMLVTSGLYAAGLRRGASAWEPLRALGRSSSSRLAIAAAICWSVTSLVHKVGIAQVGPLPWGATVTLGSALALACTLPLVAWRTGSSGMPTVRGSWWPLIALAGLCFALQQVGLHNALTRAQAGYVIAVASLSILLATVGGVVLLGERSAAAHRIAGAVLVSSGVILIALFG